MGFHKTICHGKAISMKLRIFPVLVHASENALFSKNTLDNQIKRLLLLTGFLGKPLVRSIIALHLKKRWLVTKTAYIVIDEASGKFFNVVDIINKQLSQE
jgi:hypothetical protein